ncbi:hypothetical protein HPB48_005049 [Haemaphysalis longicornis]|uniref:Uncharacterized protein n=1 Tax=Haemaphysalis longicornis TaxID=44386 RepID=A0A9J6GK48_HAELO|nr:hypothetical protein HPB48_005049 [Haemaphysalis longicornis]
MPVANYPVRSVQHAIGAQLHPSVHDSKVALVAPQGLGRTSLLFKKLREGRFGIAAWSQHSQGICRLYAMIMQRHELDHGLWGHLSAEKGVILFGVPIHFFYFAVQLGCAQGAPLLARFTLFIVLAHPNLVEDYPETPLSKET